MVDFVQPRGYAIELEDRDELRSSSVKAQYMLRGKQPELMDPRKSLLANRGFLQVEMQGEIGACQGVSLTDTGEFAFTFATGEVIQFDWMFAYLESQKVHKLYGRDVGSTLSGGTKVALEGLAPEEQGVKYPTQYTTNWCKPQQYVDRKKFLLKSHVETPDSESVRDFLGSALGIVQVGMPWGPAMQPDQFGCINEWYTTRDDGGHAWVIVGYLPDSVVGRKSSCGWWLLIKNSWSKRWGIGGYAYIDPKNVYDKFARHPHSVCYGRSDMETPIARKGKFDFIKNPILK